MYGINSPMANRDVTRKSNDNKTLFPHSISRETTSPELAGTEKKKPVLLGNERSRKILKRLATTDKTRLTIQTDKNFGRTQAMIVI